MRVDGAVVCEGVGQDARGAFTFIAVNQNIVVAPSLPHAEKRTFVVLLAEDTPDDPLVSHSTGTATFRVQSPSGATGFAISQPMGQVQKRWSDLPTSLILAADVVIQASEYGDYTLQCEISAAGTEPLRVEQHIYVIPVPTEPYQGAPQAALPVAAPPRPARRSTRK